MKRFSKTDGDEIHSQIKLDLLQQVTSKDMFA